MEKTTKAILEVLKVIAEKGIRSREDFRCGGSFREREQKNNLYNNLFILLLEFCSHTLGYTNHRSMVRTLVNRGLSKEEISLDLLEVIVARLDYLLKLPANNFIPYATRMLHNRLIDLCKATKNEDMVESINKNLTRDGFALEETLADPRSSFQDNIECREILHEYIHSLCEAAAPMCESVDFAIVLCMNVILGYKAEVIAQELYSKGVKNTYNSVIKEIETYDVSINNDVLFKETGFAKMMKDPYISNKKLQRKVSQTLNAISRRFPEEYENLLKLKATSHNLTTEAARNPINKSRLLSI